MSSLGRRLWGAATLHADTYEEVEADLGSIGQAALLVGIACAAAACGSSEVVVWEDVDQPPTPADSRWWITDVAPGVDLVGNTSVGDNLIKWSGSSFATAVASALNAKDGPPAMQLDDGLTWWIRKPLPCDDIEGLLVE